MQIMWSAMHSGIIQVKLVNVLLILSFLYLLIQG